MKFDTSTKAGRVARAKHAHAMKRAKAKAKGTKAEATLIPLGMIPERATKARKNGKRAKAMNGSTDFRIAVIGLLEKLLREEH